MSFSTHRLSPAVATLLFCSFASAQVTDELCELKLKPDAARATLHRDTFNDFGNLKESLQERGFSMTGSGDSCKLISQRVNGREISRPCTWTPRLSCELKLAQEPVTHKFTSGSFQYGKLQWVANQPLTVKVKRGDKIADEVREVAVVKFSGTWSRGPYSGRSDSTVYFDRAWGILLKAEGAHDQNKWGDEVVLIEFPQ